MKKNYFLVALSFFASTSLFAQTLNNGGFENWTAIPYFDNPDGWVTSNGAHSTKSGVVNRWGIAQEGAMAISLETREIDKNIIPGVITTGKLDTSNLVISGGQPITGKIEKFTGYYHYLPAAASGDQASFEILLTKWNSVSMKRDTIASGSYLADEFSTGIDFKAFEITLNYISLEEPDSQLVIISSSKDRANPKVGSTLWIDGLKFVPMVTVTGIESAIKGETTYAFPNPATNQVTFKVNENTHTISVFDVIGKGIIDLKVNAGTAVLNTETYAPGVYYYCVFVGKSTYTNKFIIR